VFCLVVLQDKWILHMKIEITAFSEPQFKIAGKLFHIYWLLNYLLVSK